jgi:hypothetical protein
VKHIFTEDGSHSLLDLRRKMLGFILVERRKFTNNNKDLRVDVSFPIYK